jgi:uncharacterized protein (TIGR00251 family)
MTAGEWYRWEGEDLVLRIRVQPRASRDAFAGVHGDQIKLRITAPPVDGAANEHLIGFLADAFAVPRRDVALIRGLRGKSKTVRIRHPGHIPKESGITGAGNTATPLR